MDALSRTLILLLAFTLTTCSQAQETPSVPKPQEIERVGDWWGSKESTIRLESYEDSSNLKSVYINTEFEKGPWSTRIEGEAQLVDGKATLEVAAQKTLLDSARTFASWKHTSEEDSLETGLELVLFGDDKLRLSQTLQPLSDNLQPRSELSYKYSFWRAKSLKIVGSTDSEKTEIGGEFLHKENSGFMWGASFTTQKTTAQESWGRPAAQGRLRWIW